MSFTSGRITFTRFRVHGDSPTGCDEAFLSILTEHRFREQIIGKPDEVEAGFVTAEHLLDTQFVRHSVSYDLGHVALFAMRLDTHKVPGDVMAAYRKINEEAAAGGSATGFVSRAEKREAKELAARQIVKDLADGKYRKSASYQIIWHFGERCLYFNTTSAKAIEQLSRLMRQAFAVEIEPITAGMLAGEILGERGLTRDFEDLSPIKFTDPPAGAVEADGVADPLPSLPWIVRCSHLKDWLGNELLVWLWWITEQHEGMVSEDDDSAVHLMIVAGLDMDCAWGVGGRQTLRGHIVGGGPTRLKEAGDALATGKWPRKLGLVIDQGDGAMDLALQAESLNVSSAKIPEIEDAATPRELVETRIAAIRDLGHAIDYVFRVFLTERYGDRWGRTVGRIRRWIKDRSK